ncbi:Uma2 family endonuclease [Kitasatospora purpeofusca]|uniref:Uma2 family endonuclease n=2 Tax=Kitasatospora purpeofusca TaxID=67352 RepID=UPI00224F72EC|nr:Uma2 family endonuclease [Kitasatospora purpeofusca]MCX4754549.1 Uma2 family endonuclease [Kitasatospora purpeofusca]WSR42176.1 Uma2 family endonuclease [Kitasatospora purpeofusca]
MSAVREVAMTAMPIDGPVEDHHESSHPLSQLRTYEQAKHLDLPFDWDLVDGVIVVRGQTNQWHDQVRDELYSALRGARVAPYAANVERCVLLDEANTTKPDVVVFDKTGIDVFELECLPPRNVVLTVEVVSHGTRANDRFRKPGQYADKGIPYYWRVERGIDDLPIVHEFHRDEEKGVYLLVAQHEGVLRTSVPYPVEIDLAAVVEL